jgi:hypothetical protein
MVVAPVESGEALSDDDMAAWRWASDASIEYHHANNALGDWYREGGRHRALERYIRFDPTAT